MFDRDEVLEDPLDALDICSSLVTVTVDNDSDYSDSDYNGSVYNDSVNNDSDDSYNVDPFYEFEYPSRQVVTLAHYSVKEYLISPRIWTGNAAKYGMRDNVCHDVIARSCLGYLLQFQQPQLDRDCLSKFRLARYSAEFWTSHVQRTGERTEEIDQIAIRLCSKESSAYVNWIRLSDPEQSWRSPDFARDLEDVQEPLYYAVLLDLRGVVKMLLDKGADVNAQGGEYGNAL